MPPKAKYDREEIVETAYALVREQGMDALTARSLAGRLGTSTAPLFTAFRSVDEIQQLVFQKAKALYEEYLQEGLAQTPPFKGAGLKYIQFAKDEPQLFKLLFMSTRQTEVTHYMPAGFAYEAQVRQTVEGPHNLGEWQAKHLYNHLSVYAHGLAVLYAQGQCMFTMEDVDRMLTEVFVALKKESVI